MLADIRPVKGYEGYYEVTDDGRVWSVKRKIFLRQKSDKDGYLSVGLTKDNHTRYFRIHRLVAEAFIPNPEQKPIVNHLNENKSDNRVCNLDWATVKENNNYGTRNFRMARTKCRKPVERVCPDGTIERYQGVKDASRKTGIAHSQIRNACLNLISKSWAKEWRYAV